MDNLIRLQKLEDYRQQLGNMIQHAEHREKKIASGEEPELNMLVLNKKMESIQHLIQLLQWMISEEWEKTCELKQSFQAEDDRIILRPFTDAVREAYISSQWSEAEKLAADTFDAELVQGKQLMANALWHIAQREEALYCSITDKQTMDYIGCCSVSDLSEELWEINIEICEKFQRFGYGTDALRLFTNTLAQMTSHRSFRLIVEPENLACQRLLEEAGVQMVRINPIIRPEDFNYEIALEQRQPFITPEVKALAERTGMDLDQLMVSVLEYKMEAEPGVPAQNTP